MKQLKIWTTVVMALIGCGPLAQARFNCNIAMTCPPDVYTVATNGCQSICGPGGVAFGTEQFNQGTASATDTCDSSPTVSAQQDPDFSQPPAVCIEPSSRFVVTYVTIQDAFGNKSLVTCTNNLTVEAPLHVVFDSKCVVKDDNVEDNFPYGYLNANQATNTVSNAADAPGTAQILNQFSVGNKIKFQMRLFDCYGNDLTALLGPSVTVFLDVSLYDSNGGSYQDGTLINDITDNSTDPTDFGIEMALSGGMFQYNLATTSMYPAGTKNNDLFFRAAIRVTYDEAPGLVVGQEDAVFESK